MNTIRKDNKPPTNDKGERIIERAVTLSSGTFGWSTPQTLPGESIPTYSGVSLRIEEAGSRRMVMEFEMSITQWMKMMETTVSGRTSGDRSAQAALRWLPAGCELAPEPEWEEPKYAKLSTAVRESLNLALKEYEDAVEDLEALHSEKAGRAAMGDGIRAARMAISRAFGNVQYANREISAHVDECLQVMLVDERFSAQLRQDAE